MIGGNLAWLDAKYDEVISASIHVTDSQYLTNAPEFSRASNFEYRTDLTNGGKLSARVGYSCQSDSVADYRPESGHQQDGYGLVGAGVIWKLNGAWQFSLQGSNLSDEEYRTTGYNIAS